jgi:hypothetical protein
VVAEGEKVGRLALRDFVFLPLLLQYPSIPFQLLQMVLQLPLANGLGALLLGLGDLDYRVIVGVLFGFGGSTLGNADAGWRNCEDRGRWNQGFCHFFDVADGRVDAYSFAVVGPFGLFLFVGFGVELLVAEMRVLFLTSVNIYLSTFDGPHAARLHLRLHNRLAYFFLLPLPRLFHRWFCQIVGLRSEAIGPFGFDGWLVVVIEEFYALLEDDF